MGPSFTGNPDKVLKAAAAVGGTLVSTIGVGALIAIGGAVLVGAAAYSAYKNKDTKDTKDTK